MSFSNSTVSELRDVFEELGISMQGAGDFNVYKNTFREGDGNTFWTVAAKKNERIIKLEGIGNMDEESAYRYIEERKYVIESLFKRIPSPYPGMISNVIECPSEFNPEYIYLDVEKRTIPVYLLYSTSRFAYGACADELVKYRGALTFVYSKELRRLFRIEIFIPKQNFDKEELLSLVSSLEFKSSIRTRSEKLGIGGVNQPDRPPQGKIAAIHNDWGDFKDYNLIIIGFDPLGVRHMGSSGYFRDTMPNLDTFSRDAFLFTNAISPSSWTLPVFMSWFTSLYPSQHGLINKYSAYTKKERILSNLSELSPSVVTLAQVLKGNGYATVGFTGDAGVGGDFGYSLGFDSYYDETTFGGFDVVLPRALNWLKEHSKKKFFLFIQGYDVHGRHKIPDDFEGKFISSGYKGKYKGTEQEYWELRNLSLDQEDFNMADTDIDFWRDWYDSKIYEADRRLGEFIKELERFDISDKTIIIISSASGNEFYEHKRFDHGHSLYDELIHVPLIIKIPTEKGRRIDSQVRTIDIMPTVLDLLSIKYDKQLIEQVQGASLVTLMKREGMRLDAFSETDYLLHTYKRSLRTPEGWKFIYTMDTELRELYNLNEDPQERNNLIEQESEIAYDLEQKLFDWLNSINQDKYYYKELLGKMFRVHAD